MSGLSPAAFGGMNADADAVQILTMESTQPVMSELRQQLPRIAHILGSHEDDVAVFDYQYWPKDYMLTDWRDRVVETHGMFCGMPTVQRTRQQDDRCIGLGLSVYENRLDPDLRYAIWTVRGAMSDESYLVAPKESVFRLRRNAIRLNRDANKITEVPVLEDGVLEDVVRNSVTFLLKQREIQRYGVRLRRGIILDGYPGNGKSMLCRYIQKLCSQNNIDWGVVSAADIDDAYKHKWLDELFRKYTLTFYDDIDIAYLDRSKGSGKMACSLLTAMDGMNERGHLVRIFTTNEDVSELDPAFTRPGRIDERYRLKKPTEVLRRRLVEGHWPEEIRSNIDVEDLIGRTAGFSFAEVEAIRTLLVTNKILGDHRWDLNKAFREYDLRRADGKKKKKGVGFKGAAAVDITNE